MEPAKGGVVWARRPIESSPGRRGNLIPSAKASVERVIWMVDDDEGFRGLSGAVALDAGINVVSMSSVELIERRGAALPDGAMLDGTVLTGPQADDLLRGIPRIVICTGREYKEIAERGSWPQGERASRQPRVAWYLTTPSDRVLGDGMRPGLPLRLSSRCSRGKGR